MRRRKKLISFNVEGLRKQIPGLTYLMDEQKPSMVLIQESKCNKIEENSLDAMLGSQRHLTINSPDQYEDDFSERLEKTRKSALP